MAWREKPEGWRIALAALLLPLLLTNCTTSPETAFNWGVNDKLSGKTVPARVAVSKSSPAQSAESIAYSQNPEYVAIPRPKPVIATSYRSTAVEVRAADPVAGAMAFAWPLSGRVISTFGSSLAGERNDGINIAAPLGTPIHAAANGSVSYAGNELKGYGNLALIRHDNGYVTAYAHADRLIVSRGDTVVKGQIIGYAGNTGDVGTSQLHFEIRKGVTPVNPQPLLVASR